MTGAPSDLLAAAAASGMLVVLPILLPLAGALLAFAVGGRVGMALALAAFAATALAIAALLIAVAGADAPVAVALGGWAPPLGITLQADGLAAAVLGVAAVVLGAVALQAAMAFRMPQRGAWEVAVQRQARQAATFWPLALMLSASLATLVLARDLFTLHVALELLTFAAAPLLCLDGRAETMRATLRYILFAMLGSMLLILGIVILYGLYGTLDLGLLAEGLVHDWPTAGALALITAGLAAKSALAPLHLWLPLAHAGAAPVVSAVLSGLVAKGGFVVLVRVWFDMAPTIATEAFAVLIGGLGLSAVALGSLVALQQRHLKRMIAYSTVAQIGYLFVLFPLAFDAEAQRLIVGPGLAAGILQFMTHATAKAALFLAAGVVVVRIGSDDLAALRGVGRRTPVAMLAMGLALLALAGAPPGGSWAAKELAAVPGASFWSDALKAAGALTAGYLGAAMIVLLRRPDGTAPRWQWGGTAAAVLGTVALTLGLMPLSSVLWIERYVMPVLDAADVSSLLPSLAAGAVLGWIFGGPQDDRAGAQHGWPARIFADLRAAARWTVAPAATLDAQLSRWSAAGMVFLATLAAVLASLAPAELSLGADLAVLLGLD